MAATTGVNIETQYRMREQVLDTISKVDPYGERVLLTSIGRLDATSTKVEWTKQKLETPSAANTNVHGFTTSFALTDFTARTQDYNYTQLMKKQVSVDLSEEAVKKAGIADSPNGELENQKDLKYNALLNDVEATIISNNTRTAPLPVSNTAGISGGVQTFISTNSITAGVGDFAEAYLTPEAYDTLAQKCRKSGGMPDKTFCGIQAKRAIAGWITQVNRPVSDSGKKLTKVINQYETVSGMQDVVLSLNLTTVLLMLETGRWKTAWLREPKWYPYPDGITDAHGGSYKTEMTLVALAEESSGKISSLSYTA
jgi:hypothetical protein